MSDMMTFPDTWEEFEKSYGFTDNEEVYTNGARLIPSFRVKQWLDHLPSVQSELSNNSPELDNKNGELISRQAAIDSIRECAEVAHDNNEWDMEQGYLNAIECVKEESSVQLRKGKWIKDRDGIYHCSCCGTDYLMYESVVQDTHYCPYCGADMREKKKTLNEIRAEYGLQPIYKRGEQT